ncbi:MAG TPA: hypothetical protein VGL53_12100 [Bryobacteraceae bacterium]|jgi:hypothetical protein
MSNIGIVLLAATVLFWVLLCGLLYSSIGQTAHGDAAYGQALMWIYDCLLLCLTWACLSGLLWSAASRNILPGWTSVAVVFLCPASFLAAIGALYLLTGDEPMRWAFAIPAGIPGLLAAYVVVMSVSSWRVAVGMPLSIGVCAVAGLLSIAILPAVSYKMDAPARKEAARKAALADPIQKARRRKEGLAKISTMTPEMPIEDWADLIGPESEVREEAFAALHKVARRQGDMERLVSSGNSFYIPLVPYLDLTMTPDLCEGVKKHIWNVGFAKQLRGENGLPYREDDLDASLDVVPWFTTHGCNCDENLTNFADVIRRSYPDSPARQKCLNRIAAMKSN